jgi:multidrug transporter EmrE-like cation transporter
VFKQTMHAAQRRSRSRTFASIALLLSIGFGIAGQLLMKWAALHSVAASVSPFMLASLLLALLVYSLGILNWILALRDLPLNVAYPITSLSYAGILWGSFYWFGEEVSAARLSGVAMIFAGVLLVVLLGSRSHTARAPGSAQADRDRL